MKFAISARCEYPRTFIIKKKSLLRSYVREHNLIADFFNGLYSRQPMLEMD